MLSEQRHAEESSAHSLFKDSVVVDRRVHAISARKISILPPCRFLQFFAYFSPFESALKIDLNSSSSCTFNRAKLTNERQHQNLL